MSGTREDVTSLVSNYIANEGDMDGDTRIADRAPKLANSGDVTQLREYVTNVIRNHRSQFTAEVRNELAPNDWSEIDWDEVARQLRD